MKLDPTSQGMQVNKKELSEIFGISERTLTEYQKDPLFPFIEDGGRGQKNLYDTAQVLRYLISRIENKPTNDKSALAEAKTEQALGDAALKRIMVNEKLGVLIAKEDALKTLVDWASYTNRQIKEGIDRFIADIQSAHSIEIDKEMRLKYVSTTTERVRGYALKLAGDSDDSNRDAEDAQTTID